MVRASHPNAGYDFTSSVSRYSRPLKRGHFAAVGLVDQILSSVTNFLIVLIAARSLNVREFGLFSAVYLTYVIVVGAIQAFIGQELVLHRDDRGRWGAIRAALRAGVLLGVGLTAVGAIVGLMIPVELGHPLIVLSCFSVPLVLHEVYRCAGSLLRAPQLAVLGDSLWLTISVALTLAASALEVTPTPNILMAIWCCAGLLSMLAMCLATARNLKSVDPSPKKYFTRDFLGGRFLIEYGLVGAIQNVATLFLGVIAGAATVGALRGAMLLYSPLRTVMNAAAAFGTPLIIDVRHASRTRLLIVMSIVLGGSSLLATVAWEIVPKDLGIALLGDTWGPVGPLIIPVGLQFVLTGFSRSAYVGIRVEQPNATLILRIVASITFVAAFLGGYVLGGIEGAAWGGVIGMLVQALHSWFAYARIRLATATA